MGNIAADLIAHVISEGIQVRRNGGQVEFKGKITPDLHMKLREMRDEIWEELWCVEGRERQARAIEWLAKDRQAFVDRCICEGKYRGASKPIP